MAQHHVIRLTDPGEVSGYNRSRAQRLRKAVLVMILKLFLLWLAAVGVLILFFMGAFPQSEKERALQAGAAGFHPRTWN